MSQMDEWVIENGADFTQTSIYHEYETRSSSNYFVYILALRKRDVTKDAEDG